MMNLVARPGGLGFALRSVLAPGLLAARWLRRDQSWGIGTLPRPRPSVGLAGKILLDELFFLTEVLSSSFISAWDYQRLLREIEDGCRLYDERGWLDDPARYHREPPGLVSPVLRAGRARGLDYIHLAFDSGYRPHADEPGRDRWLGFQPNRTAHAWLLRHPGPQRPWLVCVHAYRMGFPLADFLAFPAAWLHFELGLNVAFPVLPLHGPRKVGWRTGDGVFSGDYLDAVHLQAQAVWDIRRLLRWLYDDGAPAIGVYGISLGAYTTALLASLESEIACVIAGIPATDYLALARWNLPMLIMRSLDPDGAGWRGVKRILRVISPLALTPRVPRGRRYLYGALADRLVPPVHAHDLWLHWECPRLTWYEGSHVSFGWEERVNALLLEALEAAGLPERRTG